MDNGWIKLWRKSLKNGWLENHKLWAFWCWCLMKASHKEYDHIVGCQKVHLMPGDFVFGLKVTSKELKMSIQSIRTIINFLKMSQNLTIKTTNKFSIISIVNWATYQGQDNEINTQINKQLTNKQQTTNNKQEYKELKNVKNNTKEKFLDCVFLTKEEHQKLIERDGNIVIEKAIEMLNNYKMASGKKYKSDYHAILNWAKERAKKEIPIKPRERFSPDLCRYCGKSEPLAGKEYCQKCTDYFLSNPTINFSKEIKKYILRRNVNGNKQDLSG